LPSCREGRHRLVGEYDFRNLCKLDPAKKKQITNFRRRILGAKINPVTGTADNPTSQNDALYVLDLVGAAFLYQQVRHIMAVLLLVGACLSYPRSSTSVVHSHPRLAIRHCLWWTASAGTKWRMLCLWCCGSAGTQILMSSGQQTTAMATLCEGVLAWMCTVSYPPLTPARSSKTCMMLILSKLLPRDTISLLLFSQSAHAAASFRPWHDPCPAGRGHISVYNQVHSAACVGET
jgi:hypothetical protein